MPSGNLTILILGQDPGLSAHVKELVEFMDMPHVITAFPDDWKLKLGNNRLEALFVNPDVSSAVVSDVLNDLSKLDPNVPIVMLGSSQ
ncbi:MAG TPA: hypothetical protein PKK10_01020 [Woeseiaceae bacterium]|nr:hypothetical protein [Woeseiaceae bacterium]